MVYKDLNYFLMDQDNQNHYVSQASMINHLFST